MAVRWRRREPVDAGWAAVSRNHGGNLSLGAVSTMAYTGLAWPLIDGVGSIYGMYVITGLQETHQEFDRYGKAKK